MIVFLIRRISQSALVLLAMSLLVFVGVYAIGNPVDILISPEATPLEYDEAVRALGLDKPMWEQYGIFLSNALRGNLGNSFVFNEPALKLICSACRPPLNWLSGRFSWPPYLVSRWACWPALSPTAGWVRASWAAPYWD